MKRKAVKKAKRPKPPARHKKPPRGAPAPTERDEAALVMAAAQALSLTIDPSWEDGIAFNLRLILRHAALVEEFALPDDAEPAAIFHA
jgi:Protein of unknown function (DUF4089)